MHTKKMKANIYTKSKRPASVSEYRDDTRQENEKHCTKEIAKSEGIEDAKNSLFSLLVIRLLD